jgi:hypothetical protein
MAFKVNASERMRINSSGNVGIGTTSPLGVLNVIVPAFSSRDTDAQQVIIANSGDAGKGLRIGYDNSGHKAYMNVLDPGVAWGDLIIQDGAGKVGIGTTAPEGKVHIYNGDASVAPDSDGDELVVENSGDSGISILSGESNGNTGSLIFGSQNDGNGAGVVWDYYNKILNVKTQNSSGILRFASANNSEAMRILANGNVGIGTTTPDYELDVAGDIGVDHLINHNGDTNTYVQFTTDRLRFAAGGEVLLDLYEDGTQDYVKLGDGGDVDINLNDDMFVEGSSGNVGIGTTDPSSLDANGNRLVIGGGSGNEGLTIFSGTSGLGTMLFADGNDGSNAEYRGWIQYEHTNDSLEFATASAERVRIDSSGNVGIGTTSPGYKLDVAGDARSDRLIFRTNASAPTADAAVYRAADNTFAISTNNTERMRIDTSGNVGIGETNPSFGLQIDGSNFGGDSLKITRGTSEFYVLNANNSYGVLGMSSNHDLQIRTNATTRMTIDNSGNVGIGETSIDAKLHLTTASSGLINQKFESAGSAAWRMGIAASGTDFLLDDSSDDLSTPEFAFQNDGDFHADGDVIAYSTTTSSDERLKENIKQIPYGLKEVLKMKPVEYDWKEKRGGKHDIGVIAQDIEKLIPEIIKENKDLKTKENFKSVDYGKMVAVLIKAIQEQQQQIEELKNG